MHKIIHCCGLKQEIGVPIGATRSRTHPASVRPPSKNYTINRGSEGMKLVCFSQETLFVVVRDHVVGFCVSKERQGQEPKVYTAEEGLNSQIFSLVTGSKGMLYAVYDNKLLVAWDVQSGSMISSKILKKRAMSLTCATVKFGNDVHEVLITVHKAGDIIGHNIPTLSKEVLLGGHTASVITDVDITEDQSLLLTSDRDEKIRLSSLPNVETIESYALGHKSVVSSISAFSVGGVNYFSSCGWDHMLHVWKCIPGTMTPVFSYDFQSTASNTKQPVDDKADLIEEVSPEEGAAEDDDMPEEKRYVEAEAGHYPFKMSSTPIDQSTILIAVIFRSLPVVKLLLVNGEGVNLCTQIDLPSAPADVAFLPDNKLIVLLPKPHSIAIYKMNFTESKVEAVDCTEDGLGSIASSVQGMQHGSFTQDLVSQALSFEAETGMKKHNLDPERRFKVEEDIDFTARKGSKRSKKKQ